MQERRAGSWLELQELLFAESWNDELGLFRSSFAYRGSSDAAADLRSGLVRLGGDTELERQLMRAFRKYAMQDAVPHDTAWDWLALGPASRPADAPPRLDVLAVRRPAFRDLEPREVRPGRSRVVHRLRPGAREAAAEAARGARPGRRESLHDRAARRDRARARRPRAARRRLRPLRRAAVVRRAHRQPVRALLGDLAAPRRASTTGSSSSPTSPARRHPARAEMGSARQARPGEHHRARPLPRSRRHLALARPLLRAARHAPSASA